jgi:hypothetical protein
VAGDDWVGFSGYGGERGWSRGARVREISGREGWGWESGGGGLFYRDICVVWGEFVLEGEKEGAKDKSKALTTKDSKVH